MNGVEGAETLVGVFGQWPSFHDAEVVRLFFERTDQGFDVRAAIHTWASTSETDERGHYRLHKHTLVTFLFSDCEWPATDLRGFGYQNVIFDLHIQRDGDWFVTQFEPCYGLYGTVRSRRVALVSVQPWEPPRLTP